MPTMVRRATSADAALLSSLNAEVQAIHAEALPTWFKPPGPPAFPPGLMDNPSNLVFVAEVGAVRAEAASRNVALLGLDVWSFNADARAFFQRQGFAPYNERLWSKTGEAGREG